MIRKEDHVHDFKALSILSNLCMLPLKVDFSKSEICTTNSVSLIKRTTWFLICFLPNSAYFLQVCYTFVPFILDQDLRENAFEFFLYLTRISGSYISLILTFVLFIRFRWHVEIIFNFSFTPDEINNNQQVRRGRGKKYEVDESGNSDGGKVVKSTGLIKQCTVLWIAGFLYSVFTHFLWCNKQMDQVVHLIPVFTDIFILTLAVANVYFFLLLTFLIKSKEAEIISEFKEVEKPRVSPRKTRRQTGDSSIVTLVISPPSMINKPQPFGYYDTMYTELKFLYDILGFFLLIAIGCYAIFTIDASRTFKWRKQSENTTT